MSVILEQAIADEQSAASGPVPGAGGGAIPWAPQRSPAASISASSRAARPASNCCSSTSEDASPARARHSARSGGQPDLSLLARLRAGRAAGPALRLSRARAVRSRARACASTRQAPARSLRPRRRGSQAATAARPPAAGDNAATAMKSVVVDPRTTTGKATRRCAGRPSRTIIYEMHVRGFTRHPSSGVAERDARHLRRPDREDPLSPGTRHHRRRAAAGLPVRRPGLPAGPGQLLGLRAGLLLRAAPGATARARIRSARSTSFGTWSRRCTGRASRSSSTSSSTTPPKATTRADPLLPRPGQPRLLHPRAGPLALRQLQRHGQHAQRQPPDRPPDDRGQPALLGRGDARRRLPLRPGLDPGPRSSRAS